MPRPRPALAVGAAIAVVVVLIIAGAVGALYLSQASAISTLTTTATTTSQVTGNQTLTQTDTETTTIACETVTTVSMNDAVTAEVEGCGNSEPTNYQVTLAVTPTGAGSTSPSSNTTLGIQEKGILVQITATPNPGYVFTSWTATTASITFGCTTCNTTSAEVDGSGTIVANFAAESGSAYVTQDCSAHGYYQQTVSCTLPSPVKQGQTILLDAAVIPGTNVSDSMGDSFALVARTSCPCSSTYMIMVYSVTASSSGTDTITVQGAGNYDSIAVDVLSGVTQVENASFSSGTSTTPGVQPFHPPVGSFVVGVALINNTEGVFGTTVSAGQGYTLLAAGPDIAEEAAISTGNSTGAQFVLQTPENWAEVSVVFGA